MAIYELDPVDRIAIAAVGEPGQRRFFLLATGSGRTLTLGCEKSQLKRLSLRPLKLPKPRRMEGLGGAAAKSRPGQGWVNPRGRSGGWGLGYQGGGRLSALAASK